MLVLMISRVRCFNYRSVMLQQPANCRCDYVVNGYANYIYKGLCFFFLLKSKQRFNSFSMKVLCFIKKNKEIVKFNVL